jgi:polyisoprenoid-binding protein YceI
MAWAIDNGHSAINFSARHMMISTVRGNFNTFTGTVDFDEADPTKSTVDIQIDVASLETRDEKRDGHLKSADFFEVEKYPTIAFKSTSVEKLGENHGKLHGNLTIKDVSKPVTLDVEYHGLAKAPWGTTSAGFIGKTSIDRKDWGLTWNVALETGGILVGDKINIEIDIEVVKQ